MQDLVKVSGGGARIPIDETLAPAVVNYTCSAMRDPAALNTFRTSKEYINTHTLAVKATYRLAQGYQRLRQCCRRPVHGETSNDGQQSLVLNYKTFRKFWYRIALAVNNVQAES